jgi:hypothetical protein
LDVGGDTSVYNLHVNNIVLEFRAGGSSLAFEDSDNFTLELNITNLGTSFRFTEVFGDGSNDFGDGQGLDLHVVAEKTNGVLSANGSMQSWPDPTNVFRTPWGTASLEFSLDISDVVVEPLGGNHFGIAFGNGIDFSFTLDSTTTFPMHGAGVFEVTVVPIPPAIWLFGSGSLGLIGIARKKAA